MPARDGTRVEVTAAKGRPMLSWVGKRPLREVRSFPAQLVERFAPPTPVDVVSDVADWSDWPDRFDRSRLLFHGDNKEVLAHLLANGFRGKVDLVYIDPPFDSGADYVRKVQLRGASGSARLGGEDYTLGEQIQYTDIWANDTYLQFMYERLLLIKELMTPSGCVYLHCDPSRNAYLRLLMDEVFGPDSFVNEVVWQRNPAHSDSRGFGSIHDSILFYAGGRSFAWNSGARLHEYDPKTLARYTQVEEGTARFYQVANVMGPGGRGSMYDWNGHVRAWRYSRATADRLEREGKIVYSGTGFPGLKDYLDEKHGVPLQDVWTDITLGRTSSDRTDYPTQKPEEILDRIIASSTNPGDIVLDCFIGSGTTAAVAQKLGRRWIGADINKGAIQTTEKRLAAIIDEQIAAGGGEQLTIETAADAPPKPAQTSFTVHRVNDYDLQIQHNEAVELAVEHLGISRTRTDAFFTGTLGKELAYVVPFDHPTTVLDLQAVARELDARPTVELDVVVVGLGLELATQAWLENHNRHRPVNKVRVIDLRTDPKHGRFFEHRPASARVSFERADGRIRVRIDDFMSPSILERLSGEQGILAPSIDDWRSMVDSVAIDAAYDGEVFDVDMIDIPSRRSDLVEGSYDLATPAVGADRPAAVRITHMLGEEILLVEDR